MQVCWVVQKLYISHNNNNSKIRKNRIFVITVDGNGELLNINVLVSDSFDILVQMQNFY